MAKKIEGYINLQVKAGAANPSPPIGPALGQRGLSTKEFCDAFNTKTKGTEAATDGTKLPVIITYYSDKSFTFIVKGAPATALLMKAANVKKGSPTPHTVKVAKITREQLLSLAKSKAPDLNAADLEAAMRTLAGSARSMGIEVEV